MLVRTQLYAYAHRSTARCSQRSRELRGRCEFSLNNSKQDGSWCHLREHDEIKPLVHLFGGVRTSTSLNINACAFNQMAPPITHMRRGPPAAAPRCAGSAEKGRGRATGQREEVVVVEKSVEAHKVENQMELLLWYAEDGAQAGEHGGREAGRHAKARVARQRAGRRRWRGPMRSGVRQGARHGSIHTGLFSTLRIM